MESIESYVFKRCASCSSIIVTSSCNKCKNDTISKSQNINYLIDQINQLKEIIESSAKKCDLDIYLKEINDYQDAIFKIKDLDQKLYLLNTQEYSLKLEEIRKAIENISFFVYKEIKKISSKANKENKGTLTLENISEFTTEETVDLLMKLHFILKQSNCIEILKLLINKILLVAKDIEYEQGSRLVKSIMKELASFDLLEISCCLNAQLMGEIKSILIDFMYRFKDKKPCYTITHSIKFSIYFCKCEDEYIYEYFDTIMDVMSKYQFIPSSQLQEEYKQAPINNLDFPDFETLHKEIGMTEEDYLSMKKCYDKSEKYTFFYNPDQEIETNIEVDENQHKMFEIGYFKQSELRKEMTAGINFQSHGVIIQSCLIENLPSFFVSVITPDESEFTGRFTNIGEDSFDYETIEQGTCKFYEGDVYIGCLKEQSYYGKGMYIFKNGKVEISEFVNGCENGPTLIKDSNGEITLTYLSNGEKIILNSH